jgi:hypothetical protein
VGISGLGVLKPGKCVIFGFDYEIPTFQPTNLTKESYCLQCRTPSKDISVIDNLNLSLSHPRSWCVSLEPGVASMELEIQAEAGALA